MKGLDVKPLRVAAASGAIFSPPILRHLSLALSFGSMRRQRHPLVFSLSLPSRVSPADDCNSAPHGSALAARVHIYINY